MAAAANQNVRTTFDELNASLASLMSGADQLSQFLSTEDPQGAGGLPAGKPKNALRRVPLPNRGSSPGKGGKVTTLEHRFTEGELDPNAMITDLLDRRISKVDQTTDDDESLDEKLKRTIAESFEQFSNPSGKPGGLRMGTPSTPQSAGGNDWLDSLKRIGFNVVSRVGDDDSNAAVDQPSPPSGFGSSSFIERSPIDNMPMLGAGSSATDLDPGIEIGPDSTETSPNFTIPPLPSWITTPARPRVVPRPDIQKMPDRKRPGSRRGDAESSNATQLAEILALARESGAILRSLTGRKPHAVFS